MKKYMLVLFVAVLLLAQIACSLGRGVPGKRFTNQTTSRSSSHFTDKTEVVEIVDEVNEGMRYINLDMDFDLKTGSISWKLIDPKEAIRLEGEAVAGEQIREQHNFDVIPGEWKLVLDIQEASGGYEINWEAR